MTSLGEDEGLLAEVEIRSSIKVGFVDGVAKVLVSIHVVPAVVIEGIPLVSASACLIVVVGIGVVAFIAWDRAIVVMDGPEDIVDARAEVLVCVLIVPAGLVEVIPLLSAIAAVSVVEGLVIEAFLIRSDLHGVRLLPEDESILARLVGIVGI